MAERARRAIEMTAVEIILAGKVQGVGFRPFVYRLARECGVRGQVRNRLGDVEVVACGPEPAVATFRDGLIRRAPPLSRPYVARAKTVPAKPTDDFVIVESSATTDARISVPTDYFMCDDCRRELNDPADRRFRYPFINCTQCGPRYTLIRALPYDRPNTSMAGFPLCPECEAEYRNPADRRFHAEPVSCPACGPQLSFVASNGAAAAKEQALDAALERLRAGQTVAVKGVGGYHLLCDARATKAVARLRARKRRIEKPLAVMFPLAGVDGLDVVRQHAHPSDDEAALLISPARPIVLVEKRAGSGLAANVAPALSELGAFLPYSPLHQLLLQDFAAPLVATSGNVSGEPVLTENAEANQRLKKVTDAFLHHNRPIVRPADDSVVRVIAGRARPLRIGRGAAPLEMTLPNRQPSPLLAVGGHMKGTVALSWEDRVVVSPHIGEMDTPRSLSVFEELTETLQSLYGVRADRIAFDAHPGYTTHRWARAQGLPGTPVWHHHAHASALVGEACLPGRWLVFTWDGVGYGEDGTLWGGEALHGRPGAWRRVASFRTFRLPGGDRAGREPWRSAAALHWECGREWRDCPDRDGLARAGWEKGMNCARTSSAGRLFDAAAALIAAQTEVSFEAQGPMVLESLCRRRAVPVSMPLTLDADGVLRSDWAPLLDLMSDAAVSATRRAEVFHASMALAILEQLKQICRAHDVDHVGLSGGVFQNRVLTEHALELLAEHGFDVHLPARLPCNDAALSFGQAMEIAARTGGTA